jgi:hypothetical protein
MTTAPSPTKPAVFKIVSALFFGLVVCVFSLNGVLRNFGGRWPATRAGGTLLSLASIPDSLYNAAPGGKYFLFELLVRWVLLSLAAFLCLLLLNSIRHRTVNIFVSGAGGLLLGLFALTWVSLLVFVAVFVYIAINWVVGLLLWVIAGILSFVFWPPVLFTLVGIGVVAGAALLIAQLRNLSLEEILEWVKGLLGRLSAKPLLAVLGVIAAAAVVWFVAVPLWREYIGPILAAIAAWLSEYVAPVLVWIFSALITLVLALLGAAAIVVALFILGRQLMDQLASAHACGRDMHSAFAAGFAVGAAAGLSLLVCSTNDDFRAIVNASWAGTSSLFARSDVVGAVYAFMPASAEALLRGLFVKASLPIFDSALLVVTLFLANCSLLMGLLSGVTIVPLKQLIARDRLPPLFNLVFALLVGVAIVAINSAASEDS